MRGLRWLRLVPLLACCLLLLLLGVSPWGLWEPDEGRYADVAREMLDRGDFLTPHIDGVVFLDKPPLVYWVTAASLRVWGQNETGARFGQILFAAGILLVTRRLGILLFDRRRGNIGVVVLVSSAGFFAATHVLTLDLALTFFVCLSLLQFLKGYRAGPEGRRSYLGMFAALGGGVLTKGPIGALLPAMVVACFLTLRGEWRRARELPWLGGTLLFAAIVTPWYLAVSLANPEFPAYFFLHEHLARFATSVHNRPGPWYYYLAVTGAGLLPWSLLLPLHLLWSGFSVRLQTLRQIAPAFLWSWIVPGLLFFSAAQSKLPLYILPLFPAAALLLGSMVDRDLRERSTRAMLLWPSMLLLVMGAFTALHSRRIGEWNFLERAGIGLPLVLIVAGLAVAALFAAPILAKGGRPLAGLVAAAVLWMSACYAVFVVVGRVNFFNETKHFASVLRREMSRGEPVFAYRCYLRGLPFYLGETVGLVLPHSDDLKLGLTQAHDPASFLDEGPFLAHLAGDERVFVVLRHKDLQPLQRRTGRPLYILARSDLHDLVSNTLGREQGRALRALLDSTGFDWEAALDRALRSRPGAIVEMIEIERIGGEPTCTVRMLEDGSRFEISLSMTRPTQLIVGKDDPAGEDSGSEDHLLRLSPSPERVPDLSQLIRVAAGR